MIRMLAAAVAGLMVTAATAQPPVATWLTHDAGDPYGAESIQEGRYAAVQKRLNAAYVRGERSTELLLNLAAMQKKNGGVVAANSLYREVLQQPNISLVTLSGTSWSHDVAQRGLAGSMTTASR